MDATEGELLAQAAACPLIRNAYRTGDPDVITKTLAMHPLSRCAHIKRANESVAKASHGRDS